MGKWLSVQGLVDPVYTGRYGTSLSITITSNSQLRTINETEARHRLKSHTPTTGTNATDNRSILAGLGTSSGTGRSGARGRIYTPPAQAVPHSKNQAILNTIQQSNTAPSQPTWAQSRAPVQPPARNEIPWGWITVGGVVLFMLIRALA